tara:strand:+ start:671 stop:910 length:240 start_codon:yes stop_codon:yes gene_type:complete
MKIDDFLKAEMNWSDRDLAYRPVIGYWKVAELLQKWGEKQLTITSVSKCYTEKDMDNAYDKGFNDGNQRDLTGSLIESL